VLFRSFHSGHLQMFNVSAREFKTPYWLEGGWGVDVLLHEETRWHTDLDVIIESRYSSLWVEYLLDGGWEHLEDDRTSPWFISLGHEEKGLVYDLRFIDFDAEGNGHAGPDRVYPAAALKGKGSLNTIKYQCLSPRWQVKFHSGYDVDAEDWRDMQALQNKYRVKLPPEYDKFRELPAP
jgi:lincosamide nucleotidyltransferase A/C/D/E